MPVSSADLKMKPVPIELDKPRNILYTLYGLSELQEAVGSFDALMERLQGKEPRFKDACFLIWAGLIHEDDTLTPKQVGNMVGLGEMREVLKKAMDAFMAAMPDASQSPTEAAPAQG